MMLAGGSPLQLGAIHSCQLHGHESGCPVLQSCLLVVWAGIALSERWLLSETEQVHACIQNQF